MFLCSLHIVQRQRFPRHVQLLWIKVVRVLDNVRYALLHGCRLESYDGTTKLEFIAVVALVRIETALPARIA